MSSALQSILDHYRQTSQTEREKGTYFEELIRTYLRHEASYADLYSDVWLFADWAREIGTPEYGISAKDTGIDLVARTQGTGEYHAIQCKCYAPDSRVQKADIDSFFTASGRKPFTQRIIVTTTNDWSANAEDALAHQQPPVYKIDLHDLENSQIDWARYQPAAAPVLKPKFPLRPHQKTAQTKVLLGFQNADRGKLIMACGTGKTFTSLKIAEEVAGKNKTVLFLVPSLNLLSQTLTEWTQQSSLPLHSFAVCSDAEVGKKRRKDDEDSVATFAHELRYPATTDARRLAQEFQKRHDAHHMSVVFSTYHSLEVLSRAQQEHGLPAFDLVICDEAHRTTGATFESEDESNFVRVHDNTFLQAAKRLYMTATPRIYSDAAEAQAEKENTKLYGMNDEEHFGKQFHALPFSEAVDLKLLTDYKVLVLTISEDHVSSRLQELLRDENNQLKVDDAARIIGCWKALSKQGLHQDLSYDPEPMRRAVAFCQVIERQKGSRTHKVSSKQIAAMFQAVVDAYQEQEDNDLPLRCEAAHVDGSMNASEKETKLQWLKDEPPANTCRILSNVRCLSEGVDVPALDAVLFLTPRNSPVDVVQSVGRVMRRTPDGKKKLGYVILPVVIPAGMEPHKALDENKVYKVVWDVLQALRSHDDRFDAFINKLDLIGKDPRKMEVIAITDKIQKKATKAKPGTTTEKKAGKHQHTIAEPQTPYAAETQTEFQFNVGELERALYARIVKKCGNRSHWEDWANDIAEIAKTHISRISKIVSDPKNTREVAAFQAFAHELRDDLNDSITDQEVIEMLAQHLITKPVFDALFAGYSFASHNPVSQAMQGVLDVLQEHRLDKEADTLEAFYASVARRAEGIDNAEGKQKIVVELYDKFFRNAFPRMTERLGIVYTPVEVVDFIIHSINDLLQTEFGQTLGSKGVHIIDPFTGTGTFITRLLQSGLIKPEELPHKYKQEIHANEIVLLAYYIAAINIEAVYHSLLAKDGGKPAKYEPFEGICLTDTFQMYEKDDLVSDLMEHNSARRKRQKKLDIRVIMGNPPYNAGAKSEGDGTGTIAYSHLDERTHETYKAHSSSTSSKDLDNSYIRAIRWGTDRLGQSGVMAYVSGNGWLDKGFADGMRKCLAEDFDRILVVNLRGDVRKNMFTKGTAKEGGNVFGGGCMNGITISFFVKGVEKKKICKIEYYDIGDDLPTESKLNALVQFQSVRGINAFGLWKNIEPNVRYDWIAQRDLAFEKHPIIGDKKGAADQSIFSNYSLGVNTNRDPWCYNFSRKGLCASMQKTIAFYNTELDRFYLAEDSDADSFISKDLKQIKWSSSLIPKIERGIKAEFRKDAPVVSMYRPFQRVWLYYDKMFNHRTGQMLNIFPHRGVDNILIVVTGVGARSGFSAFVSSVITDLHTLDTGQCFPLYLYDKAAGTEDEDSLFSQSGSKAAETYTRRDAITDAGLAHFQSSYPSAGEGDTITKEDLFYYIYGLLHSPDYRSRYADNLGKELPRIPAVKRFADFQAYTQAGRDLAHWHLHYETVPCYEGITLEGSAGTLARQPTPGAATAKTARQTAVSALLASLKPEDCRVTKMKFAKVKDPETGKSINDKTTVHYNERLTVRGIPLEAYDYVVNGKPALEWVMERQAVTTDKDSGIVNDANLWAPKPWPTPATPSNSSSASSPSASKPSKSSAASPSWTSPKALEVPKPSTPPRPSRHDFTNPPPLRLRCPARHWLPKHHGPPDGHDREAMVAPHLHR